MIPSNLTSREHDVLHRMVAGRSYKMIAAELDISYHTVDSHIRKIYQKLAVNSMTEAVVKAITFGMTPIIRGDKTYTSELNSN